MLLVVSQRSDRLPVYDLPSLDVRFWVAQPIQTADLLA